LFQSLFSWMIVCDRDVEEADGQKPEKFQSLFSWMIVCDSPQFSPIRRTALSGGSLSSLRILVGKLWIGI